MRSRGSTLLSAEVGYAWRLLRVSLEGFNRLDARASDIDYFYASRLPGEPAEGVADIHTHPEAPRELRLRLATAR